MSSASSLGYAVSQQSHRIPFTIEAWQEFGITNTKDAAQGTAETATTTPDDEDITLVWRHCWCNSMIMLAVTSHSLKSACLELLFLPQGNWTYHSHRSVLNVSPLLGCRQTVNSSMTVRLSQTLHQAALTVTKGLRATLKQTLQLLTQQHVLTHLLQQLQCQHLNRRSGLHHPVRWRQSGLFRLSQCSLMPSDRMQKNWLRPL